MGFPYLGEAAGADGAVGGVACWEQRVMMGQASSAAESPRREPWRTSTRVPEGTGRNVISMTPAPLGLKIHGYRAARKT